jgi:hypothetical protein
MAKVQNLRPSLATASFYTFGISGVLSAHDAKHRQAEMAARILEGLSKTSPLFGTAMSPLVDSGLVIAHVGGPDKGAPDSVSTRRRA